VRIDKPYSLQRFQLSATESRTRYDSLPNLDFDSRNYRAAWLWALTPRLTGTLSDDRVQSQIPFALIGGTQLNQSTSENRNFALDGWVAGAWHVLAGYGTTTSTTTQAILSTPAFISHHVDGGLRYAARSGNSITFLQRWIPTDNTNVQLDTANLIDTGYTDTESDLAVHWQPTGKSSLDGGVTYKARDNMHFSQRNFSGTAARLIYGWTPTGKLSINASALRTISPYAAFGNTLENSTYVVNQTVSLGASWSISGKTSANLSFTHTHSDYRGPVFVVTSAPRVDDLNVAQLGIGWNAERWISLNASLVRTDRSSNIASFQYTANTALISASLNF
jgi:exopolysaccharide biosynthesis operon protein EpsL